MTYKDGASNAACIVRHVPQAVHSKTQVSSVLTKQPRSPENEMHYS